MAYNFKNEEEVKEYLQNIGTEYRFSCLKERNAEGCHLLGDYLEAVKHEYVAAAKVYQTNCDELNYAKSCFKYGNFSYLGLGVEENVLNSFKYYKKACSLDSAEGCLHAGVMLTSKADDKNKKSDQVIEKDYIEGLKCLEKSCALGNTKACYFASGIYIKGAEGIPKDYKKASEYSLLACNGRNIFACMNLSQMYKKGDGVEKDEKKAEEYKERAKEIRDDMRRKRTISFQTVS